MQHDFSAPCACCACTALAHAHRPNLVTHAPLLQLKVGAHLTLAVVNAGAKPFRMTFQCGLLSIDVRILNLGGTVIWT